MRRDALSSPAQIVPAPACGPVRGPYHEQIEIPDPEATHRDHTESSERSSIAQNPTADRSDGVRPSRRAAKDRRGNGSRRGAATRPCRLARALRPSRTRAQLVVERAHEEQVVQIGPASVLPPHDVMGLGEATRAAARKPALGVPVPELAHHPRRRLSGHPPEAHRVARCVFDHHLDPPVAGQALGGLGVDDPTPPRARIPVAPTRARRAARAPPPWPGPDRRRRRSGRSKGPPGHRPFVCPRTSHPRRPA